MSTADVATDYVRKMVAMEHRGNGDTAGAVSRLCTMLGLEYWPMEHLRRGNAKTVEAGLYRRIREAYIAYCEKQVARLKHEIEIEKAVAADDDMDLHDLERQVASLEEKIAAKKTTTRRNG